MTFALLRLLALVLFTAQAQVPSQLTITMTDATGGRVANTTVVLSRGTQEFGGTTNDEGVLVLRDVAVESGLASKDDPHTIRSCPSRAALLTCL